jgi:phosphoglycerate dehydrogenase-like enzyme
MNLLEAADVLLISAPLTRATCGLIGAAELGRMKEDAILVKLARARSCRKGRCMIAVRHPRFTACIDAWWIEPVRRGEFHQITRFSTCRTSSLRRTTQDRAGRARYRLAACG